MNTNRSHLRSESGFTLPELVVVIVVLSLIMIVGLKGFSRSGSIVGYNGEKVRVADSLGYARNASLSFKRYASVAFLPAGTMTFNQYEVRLWNDDLLTYNVVDRTYDMFKGVICSLNSMTTSVPVDEVRFLKNGSIELLFNHVLIVNPNQDVAIGLSEISQSTSSVLTVLANSGMLHH